MSSDLSAFQRQCSNEVGKYLKNTKFTQCKGVRELTEGEEAYLTARVLARKRWIDIFIYRCEAGFMIDGRGWYGFARQDYASDAQQIEDFINKLRRYMAS